MIVCIVIFLTWGSQQKRWNKHIKVELQWFKASAFIKSSRKRLNMGLILWSGTIQHYIICHIGFGIATSFSSIGIAKNKTGPYGNFRRKQNAFIFTRAKKVLNIPTKKISQFPVFIFKLNILWHGMYPGNPHAKEAFSGELPELQMTNPLKRRPNVTAILCFKKKVI